MLSNICPKSGPIHTSEVYPPSPDFVRFFNLHRHSISKNHLTINPTSNLVPTPIPPSTPISTMPSKLPDFSSLASKPPQIPRTDTPLPSRPSPSTSAAKDAQPPKSTTQPKLSPSLNLDGTSQQHREETVSPTSACWKPNLDRRQSWSMQDHKRAMQEPLRSPMVETGREDYGFRSEEGVGKKGR